MKIKEVIERTQLTDKAIRLYIDNGLVAPSIDESYSGRKSIDFSNEDVERLKNIALLRKAGFSISDIKAIIKDDESAKTTVIRFIDETRNNIHHETEIILKLKNIDINGKVNIETICDSLSATVVKNEVPEDDMKLTFKERAKKNFAIVFSSAVMIISVLKVVGLIIYFKTEYVHIKPEKDTLSLWFFTYGGIAIIFLLSLIMLIINYNYIPVGKKSKVIERTSGAICISVMLIGVVSFFTSFLGTFFVSSFFVSQTTDPNDYMILDRFVEVEMGNEIKEIFPGEIPDSASVIEERIYEESYPFTTKYYYKYSNSIDTRFDIVAEWKLSDNEFNNAIKKLQGKEKYSMQKGDWNCLIFIDEIYESDDEKDIWSDKWNNDIYNIIIFAYNSDLKTVRYIASHAIDSYEYGPYYLSLDW